MECKTSNNNNIKDKRKSQPKHTRNIQAIRRNTGKNSSPSTTAKATTKQSKKKNQK